MSEGHEEFIDEGQCRVCGEYPKVPDGYDFDGICWTCEIAELETKLAQAIDDREAFRQARDNLIETVKRYRDELAEVRRALGMHATADECGGCGCIATSVVNKAVQAIADRDVLAMEVLAWRGHVEDTHDRNYGFCRPGCTKCESKTKAWEIAKATDASGALGRAGDEN